MLEAYLRMVASKPYYFSVVELVWLCSVMNANVIVAQRTVDAYIVEHYYLGGPGEVAIVAIDGDSEGRVAAHFERLISVTSVMQHREAARVAKEAEQRRQEEQRAERAKRAEEERRQRQEEVRKAEEERRKKSKA